MKKLQLAAASFLTLIILSFALSSNAQSKEKDDKIFGDSEAAKAEFIKTDESMSALFKNSYGYVIFPNVGKGAFIIGGAGANGTVYEKGDRIGSAKLRQVSVGFQAGGQTYREVIFFENEDALDRFKNNTIEFSGQVSAIAAKSNASANAKYADGVQVYTQGKNGLMLEASVGGQKFMYKPLDPDAAE